MSSRSWRSILLASFVIVPACSANTDSGSPGNPFGSGGSSSNTAGNAGSGNAGAVSSGGGADGIINLGSGGATGTDTPDGSCAAKVATTENVTQQVTETVTEPVTETVVETVTETVTETVSEPVAMYIMQDQSGSMIGPKWTAAVGGITAFLNDPGSAGIDVAFHLFPPNFPPLPSGCGNCDGSDCAIPMYPMGTLPAAAAPITSDLAQRQPFGLGTPIEAGLRGSTMFCTNYQAQNPGKKCVVVFVTDGAPSTCATGAALVQIVADAHAAGVDLFAVGMDGADFTLLDQIAQAGGTDCTPSAPSYACNVGDTQGFVATLNGIRSVITVTHDVTHDVTHEVTHDVTYEVTHDVIVSKPIACEYTRPQPPDGQTFDKDKVNVEYSVNSVTTKVFHTDSAATCGDQGGWYYDDNQNPTKILVCPTTCTTVQSIQNIDFRVLFGCATEDVPA